MKLKGFWILWFSFLAPQLWAGGMVLIDPAKTPNLPPKYQGVKPFYIDQFEVTLGEQVSFKKEQIYKRVDEFQAKEAPDPAKPANLAPWYEAAHFCEVLGKRLPTALEWELAAGVHRKYPWGDEPPNAKRGNFCDKSCKSPWNLWREQDGFERSSPVGRFVEGATPEGVFDLAGNLWEWTSTIAETGETLIFRGKDQTALENSQDLVIKGGSYGSRIEQLENQAFARSPANYKASYLGWRCVKDTL